MRLWPRLACAAAISVAAAPPALAETASIGGFIGFDTLSFRADGPGPETIHALTAEVRMRGDLSNSLSYDLRLYGRKTTDGLDGDYFDPTVAKLVWQSGNWEITAGWDLLFWGVAEGRNVVNVVNQRDQIRDVMNDQGLGQAMLALRYFGPSFTVEGFVLPGFRERDYGTPGRRWGLGAPVDDSRSSFAASEGREHVDVALRISGMTENLEYGLSAFEGTLREPRFRFDAATGTLVPHYVQGRQAGLDLQYTAGPALLKLEAAHVNPYVSGEGSYWATVAGVEYLPGQILNLPWDTTFYLEHNWDSRGDTGPSLFQNDIFVGSRFDFGNVNETSLRLGAVTDLDHGGVLGSATLTTRLAKDFRFEMEYLFVHAEKQQDALYEARDLDQLSMSLQWHF